MSSREYLDSHPWLTFNVDRQLERAPSQLWQLVGKVVALAQHLAETPMLPEFAQRMRLVYLVKGAVATTAIEGNTLSEEDVLQLLDNELSLPPSKEYLAVEIHNMIDAFNEIMTAVNRGDILRLTPTAIKLHNRQVLKELALEAGVVPGEVSEHGVVVGPYRGAPRRDCEFLLNELCTWLEEGVPSDTDQTPMATAVLRALLAHLYLAWIHPFGDGNGRTARLVEFQILASGGVPGPAAHLLSNHFNDTRSEYYRQLNHASRSGGEVIPFLIYALQGFYDGLQQQLGELRAQTERLLWRELVDQAIPGHRPTDRRRRELAMAVFELRGVGPVSKPAMLVITTSLARAYASKTDKTLSRDIGVLLQLGLLRNAQKGAYRAAVEKIQGLMPLRAPR